MKDEDRLQYLWKNHLIPGRKLICTCGLEVEVIHPGEYNSNAGPDFFNARLKLGALIWAGNVEMHSRASLWYHHRHHLDPAYDNVILHVVHQVDDLTRNSMGRIIPTLVVDPQKLQNTAHEDMCTLENWLPCQASIPDLSKNKLETWYTTLSQERLREKVARASLLISRYPHNMNKAFFLALASGFGLPINSLPFEMLASQIPLPLLMDIKEQLPLVEALLFGQSGLLDKPPERDDYTHSLLKNYVRMKEDLHGNPVPLHLWKFLRIRPASFPTLRIAQFASFIHANFPINEDFIRNESIGEIEQLLHLKASEYWNTHYIFGRSSPHSIKRMGKQAVQHLIINTFIPFNLAIEKIDWRKHSEYGKKEILFEMKPESNQILKNWSKYGAIPRNSFESQALIQLYKAYCMQERCMQCQIGKTIRESNGEK